LGATAYPNESERRKQRRLALELRDGISPAQRSGTDVELSRRLWSLAPLRRARHVGIYFAVGGEVSLQPFIDGAACRNKQLYAPILRTSGLRFALLQRDTVLLPNRFGIPEPREGPFIDPRSLDVVLTPLVAFDESGNRLGMGAGYYDRCFHFLRARTAWRHPKLIGVAYEIQRIPHIEPAAWDVMLWGAITEVTTYRF